MKTLLLQNATVITPNQVLNKASVLVEQGLITQIDTHITAPANTYTIDAGGDLLLPGIIDIHTDALDAEIIPRPGADIPINVAFRELERKMSGCGFTTVYHSMHLGYESAQEHSRSKYTRRQDFETVHTATQGSTLLNNKIHLRFELSGINAYDECLEYLHKGYISMLSVMDHTPGQGQYTREHYIKAHMERGKTRQQAEQQYAEMTSRPVIEGERLQNLITTAKTLNIPVASHDDDTVEKVNLMHGMGVNICEFPINMPTAQHAAQLGMHVVGGASNILRGGSLSGNVNMRDAVLHGYVNALCSDYYPPAIVHAIFKLHQENQIPLPQAVNLASLQPAKAAGISQYTGSVEIGKNADLILIKLLDNIPMVTHTIVGGNLVAQAQNQIQTAVPLTQ